MKRTDIDRRERELKRAKKKEERLERDSSSGPRSVGDYIKELSGLFYHDEETIYNIETDERILELLEEMKEELEEKNWDNVIRKAVKKTGIKKRDAAVKELQGLL